MAPRAGAFSQRQAKLKQEYASWTEQEISAAEELSRLGLKNIGAIFAPSPQVVREERDESGFFPEETPLKYVSPDEEEREDGEMHEVHHKRIAIRKAPTPEARVLGAACAGEALRLFEWDSTRMWRMMHYRLRGGHGGLVQAWVMMRHPELGTLVKAPGANVEVGRTPLCSCGNLFAAEALFCSRCGAKRPSPAEKEQEMDGPERKLGYPNIPEQPRGWQPPPSQAGAEHVAEGNLQILTALELSYLSLEDFDHEAEIGEDGCAPISSKELVETFSYGSDVYEVCHEPYIAIRNTPSIDGKIVGTCVFEQRVDTFGWDDTGLWRRVFGKISGASRFVNAWILVEKEGVGPLLQLVETADGSAI